VESYRLTSKVVYEGKEFFIQTVNDGDLGAVSSSIHINGKLSEMARFPHPREISAEEVLTLVKLKHGEKKQEIEALLKAFAETVKAGSAQSMVQLGTAFFYKGFDNEAAELFRDASRVDPENHQAPFYMAMCEMKLGRHESAIQCAKIAVERRPTWADYRNNLGEAFLAAGECGPAASEFEEAVRINMYYADAWFNLGLTYVSNAIFQKESRLFANVISRAADCINRAVLIYPDYQTLALDEGLMALRESQFDRALKLLLSVREIKRERAQKEFAPYYMRFVMMGGMVTEEILSERIGYLRGQIQKNPTYVDLQIDLAHCLFERAKLSWQEGIEQVRQTCKLNPSLAKVHRLLDAAETEYESLSSTLAKVSEKG
jgi:tetratricopeptide (TPR) repeat protein